MNGSELSAMGGAEEPNVQGVKGAAEGTAGDRGGGAALPDLEDLQLPEPALTAPSLPSLRRRPLPSDMNPNPDRLFALTSPRIIPSSPRARFAIPGSPSTLLGMPLRPIIHSPASPFPDGGPEEADIADTDVFRLDSAPMFAPRDDDEPHPEGLPQEPGRTPHPLYTPITPRGLRRRRRASRSVASSRTNKTAKSARSTLRAVWRSVRRQPKRPATDGGRSSSGSSSSSSSSSSHSSSRSSSTWAGWRFWRNSSAGSSSSGSSDTEDEWEPPTPHFTLLTPTLARTAPLAYPPHLVPGARRTDTAPPTESSTSAFDLSTSTTLAPAIERLHAFWSELRQEDGVAGDLGAGAGVGSAMPGPGEDASSYFAMGNNNQASTSSTPAVTPGINTTPAVTPGGGLGGAPGGRKLKGEAKAAVAEEKRLGTGTVDERPAWWLDVMCPTVADMRELRKILPLHPLTMEDILHQETREKIESFPTLGYYFIVFRALDESYFRYTSPDGAADEALRQRNGKGKTGRVDIIEGVGGKEGLEGVSVGAVNLYLIVFGDGIISFHFEDISKHAERVQGKIQQFGLSRTMSSHWIAYGLMDSIVDTFFPLIDFIEGETSEVEAFVSDPLGSSMSERDAIAINTRSNDEIVGIIVEQPPTPDDKRDVSDDSLGATLKIKRSSTRSVLAALPQLLMPTSVLALLPKTWTTSKKTTTESTEMVSMSRFKSFRALRERKRIKTLEYDLNHRRFNKMLMLQRIAGTRKLVTGLSRLLGAKSDVVRGLQKRSMTENRGRVKRAEIGQDITLYFDDLFDHIIAMQQSLAFYEAILSHDHPAFIGILRLALLRAKAGTDRALVGLYIVGLIVLPANILVGLFSLNVAVPRNGSRYGHVLDDGSLAGFQLFGILWAGVMMVAIAVLTFAWTLFKQMRERKALRRGAKE